MHKSSYETMTYFVERYVRNSTHNQTVVDVGSFEVNGSYKSIFSNYNCDYTGLDFQSGPNVDLVVEDPYSWKELDNESFDFVISGQALEHCEFFWLAFSEIARVLKTGSFCCIIVPSSGPEHKYPVDCWRFYPDGMKAMCKFAKLKPLEVDTNWNPSEFDDGSEMWKDTMLIAQK